MVYLMSDGYLVNNGGVVTATSEGQAIFVWRATSDKVTPASCRFLTASGAVLNDVKGSTGGPIVLNGLQSGASYSLTCSNVYGATKHSFIVNRASARSLTARAPVAADVFLIAGQSNAVGQEIDGQNFVPPAQDNVLRFHGGRLQGVNKLGAWQEFGNRYFSLTGRRVIFVPASKGGTGSNLKSHRGHGHWGIEDSLFTNSLGLVDSAMKKLSQDGFTPSFRGVLWVQGENDAMAINDGAQTKDDYKAALESIIQRYRAHFNSNLPFFIFQTGRAVCFEQPCMSNGFSLVRDVQLSVDLADIHSVIVYNGAVNFPEQGLMWDEFHYLPGGYQQMGTAAADAVASFLSARPSPAQILLQAGVEATPGAQVSYGATVNRSDYLRVSVPNLPIGSHYFVRLHDSQYLPVEVGPFTGPVENTLLGFGFIPGHEYAFQAKVCTSTGVCGQYSRPIMIRMSTLNTVGVPQLTLLSGPSFGTVVNNSTVSLSSSLKVSTSSLANVAATKYFLSISYNNGAPVEKGPFTSDFSGTLVEFGFGIGEYRFRIKGCNDQGTCSKYGDTSSTLRVQ